MTASEVRRLFAYNKWANDRMLASLDQLSDEQFTRALGSSFSSIRDTAAHIAVGEWVWLSRWQGTSPKARPDWAKAPALGELKTRFAEIEGQRSAYLSPLSDADVTRLFTFTLFDGTQDTQPLASQFQHLVNHGTYHRGQVAAMLRQVGATPAGTDLIRWLREAQ
jgi:uncharacterized damage-inducible protein DinB